MAADAAVDATDTATTVIETIPTADKLFVLFVGPNHEIYSRTLDKMRAKDPSLRKLVMTWCWPAFFITIPWLLYRKLYGWAAGLIGAVIAVSLIVPSNASTLGAFTFIGMIAKSAYVQYALKRIDKLRNRAASEEELEALIRKAGGVSVPGAVIGSILFIGFNVLAFMSAFALRGS